MSNFSEKLKTIYDSVGNDWIQKNYYPINRANLYNVMICGSIGASIATGKPKKKPNDIDFVATNLEDALNFSNDLHIKLSKYSVYYKVMHNSKTKFCPDSCTYHIRIYCPTWMPICIFVVPGSESWTYLGKYLIQKPNQIKQAAEDISKRDNISRFYFDNEEVEEDDYDDVEEFGFISKKIKYSSNNYDDVPF